MHNPHRYFSTSRLVSVVLATALTLVVAACSAVPSAPGTPTTTTSTLVPTTVPATSWPAPGPDQTAELQALLDAAPAGSTFTVDRQITVDGTLTMTRPLNVVFTPTGRLVRVNHFPATRVRPVLVVGPAASGSRFDNLRVHGPATCDKRYPTGGSTWIASYDAFTEAQHGVDVRGAWDLTFVSPAISGMHGDGFNVVGDTRRLVLSDATVTCVGRNAVSVTGVTGMLVDRGSFSGAGLWVVDVEPFGANSVADVAFSRSRIGMSGGAWLNATGPDFNCAVQNVNFTGLDLSGANVAQTAYTAPCATAQIQVGA